MTATSFLTDLAFPSTERELIEEARDAFAAGRWCALTITTWLDRAVERGWSAGVAYLAEHGLRRFEGHAEETAFGAASAIGVEGIRALDRLSGFTPSSILDACAAARVPVAVSVVSGGSKGGWSYRQAAVLVGCPRADDGVWTWRKVAAIGAPHRARTTCVKDIVEALGDVEIRDVRTGGVCPMTEEIAPTTQP